MRVVAYILSGLSLLMSVLSLFKLKVLNLALFAKVAAAALSPCFAIMGVVGAAIGWGWGALWAIPIGLAGAAMMIWYISGWTRDHDGFEEAFGADWLDRIPSQQARQMLQKRWSGFLKMNVPPKPVWERDVVFWTVPGTERDLLCDLWRPADGHVSGLAFVFYHGGGWFGGNKDFGTRPFFRHLVAQGHTVMDVAYRLCPEVAFDGIIGDVKRAIAWMKANAPTYGVDPAKIVLGGSSVGGHLAMLAGYAPDHAELTPKDLEGVDLSACGVISLYGPSDIEAGYGPWRKSNPYTDLPAVPIGTTLEPKMTTRYAGRLDILLGGAPEDMPDLYRLVSPVTHVQPGCPPTLLIQGDKDLLVDVETTNALHAKLVAAGVPAVNVVLPWADHMLDLLFPQVSPAAQSTIYDVDRFLALMASGE